MLAPGWLELFVLRHGVFITIPNNITVICDVPIFVFNGRALQLAICHMLEYSAKGLRLRSFDVDSSIKCAVLALLFMPLSWFLAIDWSNDSATFIERCFLKLVGRVQRINLSFVEKFLLVVHEVDVLDMHA